MTELIDVRVGDTVFFTVALVDEGCCGVCRQVIPPDISMLRLELANRRAMVGVEICRFCIAERYPTLAEELDRTLEEDDE